MQTEAKSRTTLTEQELALFEAGRVYAEAQRDLDAESEKNRGVIDAADLSLEWRLANEARNLAASNLRVASMALLRVTK